MSAAEQGGNVLIKVAAVQLAVALAVSQFGTVSAQTLGRLSETRGGDKGAPQRMFVSGHSLTNEPLPSNMMAIASSFGFQLRWNRQHLEGSSIKQRSRGTAPGASLWAGYAAGFDRANQPIDVLAEFRRQQDDPYDMLLITEQHSLLGSLVWNDTVAHLRHFVDRFGAHNPNGTTFFFEPWLSLNDKSDPARWVAYERAAAPVWRCIVGQMNQAIAAEGRQDRIVSIPAASALAYLVEAATQGKALAGIMRADVRSTMDSLVFDDVHLTSLGNYYVALVTFAFTFQHATKGAWHPADITAQQASALQATADAFVRMPQPSTMSLDACRSYVRGSFIWTYLGYANLTHWRKERGYLGSLYFRLKLAAQWWPLFSSDKPENPFGKAAYARH